MFFFPFFYVTRYFHCFFPTSCCCFPGFWQALISIKHLRERVLTFISSFSSILCIALTCLVSCSSLFFLLHGHAFWILQCFIFVVFFFVLNLIYVFFKRVFAWFILVILFCCCYVEQKNPQMKFLIHWNEILEIFYG